MSKTKAWLTFTWPDGDVPEITRVLGRNPTLVWRKGDSRPGHRRAYYINSGWSLKSGLPASASIEDHFANFALLIKDKVVELSLLRSEYGVALEFAGEIIYEQDDRPPLHINSDTIAVIAELGGEMDIDLY